MPSINTHVVRLFLSVHTVTHPNSMDNSDPVNNTDQDNPYDMVWVRLYHVPSLDDGGTRTMKTLHAMDRAFHVEPIPRSIFGLKLAVIAENTLSLHHVAAYELKVYEFTRSAADVLPLPPRTAPFLLASAKVPWTTTRLAPLVVVVPAMPAVASPAESEWDRENLIAVVPSIMNLFRWAVRSVQAEAVRAMWAWADQFARFIMLDLVDIPNSNGMQVMRDIPDLEKGTKRDVIIRNVTNAFFNECMEFLCEPRYQPLLCIVGTPGIGKTTSTAFFIRTLLMQGETVVYHIRGPNSRGWYFEFVPRRHTRVVVKVYPESVPIEKIASLGQKSTFYIVDPGRTKESCLLDDYFKPKFILVSSPDERHWGESEFTKHRGKDIGRFKFHPVWDLEEIQSAQTQFSTGSTEVTDAKVVERFGKVGGVPRNIFLEDVDFDAKLQEQFIAINALTKDQVIKIASKQMDAVGTFATNQPKSAIIGYMTNNETSTFSVGKVDIISASVAEKVYGKYIRDLWEEMLSNPMVDGAKIFESFCRLLMTQEAQYFSCRPCAGKSKDNKLHP
jgi:hypothetical protein